MILFSLLRPLFSVAPSYGVSFLAGLGLTVAGMVLSSHFSLSLLYAQAASGRREAQLGAAAAANYRPDALARPRQMALKAEIAQEARDDDLGRAKAASEKAGGFGFSPDTLSVLASADKKAEADPPKVVLMEQAVVLDASPKDTQSVAGRPSPRELPSPTRVLVRRPSQPASSTQEPPPGPATVAPSMPVHPSADSAPPQQTEGPDADGDGQASAVISSQQDDSGAEKRSTPSSPERVESQGRSSPSPEDNQGGSSPQDLSAPDPHQDKPTDSSQGDKPADSSQGDKPADSSQGGDKSGNSSQGEDKPADSSQGDSSGGHGHGI